MRQVDDGGYQGESFRSAAHVDDERAIYLQRVHRQFGPIAERREAGTEIVDCYAHTHCANRLQAADTVLDVLPDQAFGDLQFESRRSVRVTVDCLLDLGYEVAIAQLHW